jgi:aminoglycoside phosphotransferase (APT) family kinase protein
VKLHRLVSKSITLEYYGNPAGFGNKEIKMSTALSEALNKTRGIESGKKVSNATRMKELVHFSSGRKCQPKDRGVLIHGDHEIDSLVYHKAEPRMIGILELGATDC